MKLKNKTNLREKEIMNTLEERGDILKKCTVRRIDLFGSYVRREQKKRSDIDFLVEFD
jgi:predicted nucleotidyltransferase